MWKKVSIKSMTRVKKERKREKERVAKTFAFSL